MALGECGGKWELAWGGMILQGQQCGALCGARVRRLPVRSPRAAALASSTGPPCRPRLVVSGIGGAPRQARAERSETARHQEPPIGGHLLLTGVTADRRRRTAPYADRGRPLPGDGSSAPAAPSAGRLAPLGVRQPCAAARRGSCGGRGAIHPSRTFGPRALTCRQSPALHPAASSTPITNSAVAPGAIRCIAPVA